jgi:hypothetical protein
MNMYGSRNIHEKVWKEAFSGPLKLIFDKIRLMLESDMPDILIIYRSEVIGATVLFEMMHKKMHNDVLSPY